MTAVTSKSIFDFGAIGDGVADDTTPWLNAVAWAQSASSAEGAVGEIIAPPGFTFATSGSIAMSTPIRVDCKSFINYHGSSGSAIVVGGTAPVNGKNTGYDLRFSGLRNVPGNTASPTGVVSGAANGIEVRAMQFSRLRVDNIIAFQQYGFYGNSTNDHFSGQHVQDNDIVLGQVGYNGIGLFTSSIDNAAGAFQANDVKVQNSFANFVNMQLDTGGAKNCSSSNRFRFNAMDACATGGAGIYNYSAWNDFDLTYLGASAIFQSTSAYNRLRCSNNFSTGASFYDGGVGNEMVTGPTDSSILPAQVSAQPGVVQQNGYGVPIMVYVTATVTPSANGGTGFLGSVGSSSGSQTVVTEAQEAPQTNAVARQSTLCFLVPSMRWWSINKFGPGTVTFNSVSIQPVR